MSPRLGKATGAIEYSARVLLALRSVAGESDRIEIKIAKNKHGPSDERIFLRSHRASQTLVETTAPDSPPPGSAKAQKDKAKVLSDAVAVVGVLVEQPGLVTRKLGAHLRASYGTFSVERVGAGVARLSRAVTIVDGARRAEHHYLDGTHLPADVLGALPEDMRERARAARPPAASEEA